MATLSIDILFFIFWSFCFYKINKKCPIAVYLVKDIVCFFPPMEEDKEIITTAIKNKDKKGKKEKEEEKQFPMRTYNPDFDLTKHIKEFLLEYDFVILMTLISS